MIKPKKLSKGDTIGIISPASGIDRSLIMHSAELLESSGFKTKIGKYAYEKYSYLAGPDNHRAEDINNFFADDKVDAIFCSRGGYGASRILNQIRYDIIKSNPKIFLGYSDITAIHCAIQKKCGVITFHGPMVSHMDISQNSYNTKYLIKAICSPKPIGKIQMANKSDYLITVAPGKAIGKTAGGNLSLICSLMGTPYEIDIKDKILFFEDVDEAPYRIDRMLTQLLNAGKIQEAAGIAVGVCEGCEPKEDGGLTVEDVIYDRLSKINIPVLYGLPISHGEYNATIPEGVDAYLDADKKIFSIQESAVI